MSGFATLTYAKDPATGIAWINLNRPEALNAFNVQMRDDLFEVLSALRDDGEVRVAVFSGAGEKAFCAGADLSEFLTAPPPLEARRVRFQRDLWGLLAGLETPLLAALHGYVLGSGLELALSCDLRLASAEARFGLPEMGLGIIPAAGGTQTLPRTVGRGRALELLLTGRWLAADEALAWGLVNRVVTREELYPTAQAWAEKIAGLDPSLARRAKRAVREGLNRDLPAGLALERRLAGS